jgi:hypothetical protein
MPLKRADKQGVLQMRLPAIFGCETSGMKFWQNDNVAALALSKNKNRL